MWTAPFVLGGILLGPSPAQALGSIAAFDSLSASQVAAVQIKIMHQGPSNSLAESMILYCEGATPSIDLFIPFRQPSIDYAVENAGAWDGSFFLPLRIAPAECEALIDSLSLAGISSGDVATHPELGIALACPSTDTLVFEATFRIDRKTGLLRGRCRVTNTSASSWPGPITLTLPLQDIDGRIVNADGTICSGGYEGYDFMVLSENAIAPGASVECTVEVRRTPSGQLRFTWAGTGFTFRPVVLAGPGER